MTNLLAPAGSLLLATSLLFGALPAHADEEAPPAAAAFDGWTIKSDTVVPRKQITGIESKLGGKIKALRNVTYEVNGKKVQVNVIVPADATEADKLYGSLTKGKPEWAVARTPGAIYEFVGKNDAMEDMKKARATLK